MTDSAGPKTPRAKARLLSSAEKAAIVIEHATGHLSCAELARKWGCTKRTIQRAVADAQKPREPKAPGLMSAAEIALETWQRREAESKAALASVIDPSVPPRPAVPAAPAPTAIVLPAEPARTVTFSEMAGVVQAEITRLAPLCAQDQGARDAVKVLAEVAKLTATVFVALKGLGIRTLDEDEPTRDPESGEAPEGSDGDSEPETGG